MNILTLKQHTTFLHLVDSVGYLICVISCFFFLFPQFATLGSGLLGLKANAQTMPAKFEFSYVLCILYVSFRFDVDD